MRSDFTAKVSGLLDSNKWSGENKYEPLYWAALFVDNTLNDQLEVASKDSALNDCIRDLKSLEHIYVDDDSASPILFSMLQEINSQSSSAQSYSAA